MTLFFYFVKEKKDEVARKEKHCAFFLPLLFKGTQSVHPNTDLCSLQCQRYFSCDTYVLT